MGYSQEQINKILEENDLLKKENEDLRKIISSKRYQFANKLATSYNTIFPLGSKRRSIVGKSLNGINKVKKNKVKKNINELKKISKDFKKIIIVSGIVWNTPLPQRSHQLALEFAKRKDILVVYYEIDNFSDRCKKVKNNLVVISGKQLLFSMSVIDKQKGLFMFNNVANILLSDVETIQSKGFSLVYECIDELTDILSGGASINQKEIIEELPRLKVALFVSTAKRLTKQLKQVVPKARIIESKNAVKEDEFDYEKSRKFKTPSDLKKICSSGKEIVGYYGAISPWLDYDLIHKIAKKHPELEWVFIGVDYDGALSKLDKNINNIHYLGAKTQAELPKYAGRFNCGIIPFLPGDIAKSTSPIKLFEYMALGLPVVCTKDLVECQGYDYVYISQNDLDFEEKMLTALKQSHKSDVRDRLLEQAKYNTWEMRAKEILEAVGY